MTNVNVVADKLHPLGNESGTERLVAGYINSGAKAAQNDTWTVSNAATVEWAAITIDASGVSEGYTISGNVITLTSATATAASGMILYRER